MHRSNHLYGVRLSGFCVTGFAVLESDSESESDDDDDNSAQKEQAQPESKQPEATEAAQEGLARPANPTPYSDVSSAAHSPPLALRAEAQTGRWRQEQKAFQAAAGSQAQAAAPTVRASLALTLGIPSRPERDARSSRSRRQRSPRRRMARRWCGGGACPSPRHRHRSAQSRPAPDRPPTRPTCAALSADRHHVRTTTDDVALRRERRWRVRSTGTRPSRAARWTPQPRRQKQRRLRP